MPDEPDLPGGAGEQRALLARLRAVVEARDAENAMLRAELAAALDRERRLVLRVAELERRLGMDSSNSGMPTSKEPIGARQRRNAERRNRQASERERRKDRTRGGQRGAAHQHVRAPVKRGLTVSARGRRPWRRGGCRGGCGPAPGDFRRGSWRRSALPGGGRPRMNGGNRVRIGWL